jgi:hypothetical protein
MSALSYVSVPFIERDGIMRLVASPQLTDEDITAIRSGYEARDDVVRRALLRELAPMEVSEVIRRRLEFLAWLIAEKRLDIKIAILTRGGRQRGVARRPASAAATDTPTSY